MMNTALSYNSQASPATSFVGTRDWMSDPAELDGRVRATNRRGRRARAFGQIAVGELSAMLSDTNGHCPRCKKHFGSSFFDRWVVCFEVPLSIGGECNLRNTMIICRECEIRHAAEMGISWPRSRMRSDRRGRTVTASPGPLESRRSLPIMFVEAEEEAYS